VGVLDEAGVVLFREDGERGQRRRTENKGWAAGRGGGGGEGERCKGRGGLGFGWGGWTGGMARAAMDETFGSELVERCSQWMDDVASSGEATDASIAVETPNRVGF
jgi:hypothetical protein